MPCHTRMKRIFLQGVIWLCLFYFGYVTAVIEPGYLDFDNLPDTNFSCVGKVIGGYYADLETSCQMFHVCTIGQLDEPMDIRFLCLNGTVFDQETRVCERVDEVDCSKSEKFYHLNLELYGNTAPPIVEEHDSTEPPIISSTTTTTTFRPTSTLRTTRGTYYTTVSPSPPTTHSTPKVITSNQFPVNSGPDIRFNPEEINIRLTPGSPPIIKGPSVSFQQHAFNGGDSRITVTTHPANFKDERTSQKTLLAPTTQKPKSIVNYGLQHSTKKTYQQHMNYDYNYQQTENTDIDYHTDFPSSEYSDLNFDGNINYDSSNNKKQIYSPSTTTRTENKPYYSISSTTYPSSSKPHQRYNYHRTDKPSNLQLTLPLFPTLPPLTFSSPAPFTLTRHVETKRSNEPHRPRIIVSASASVSDASGRRLNYSLGTIGASHILGKPPQSYDEYKEGDVGLDPFYHDVPKVNNKPRRKRDLEKEISTEESSTEKNDQTTHWTPPEYIDDNYEPLTYNDTKNNTLEITKSSTNETKSLNYEYYDEYIDDNYEPSIYLNNTSEDDTFTDTLTVSTTTEGSTEPSTEIVTQESTIEANTGTESMHKYLLDTTELPATTTDDKTTLVNEETTSYIETDQTSTIENSFTTDDPYNYVTSTRENSDTFRTTIDSSEFITSTTDFEQSLDETTLTTEQDTTTLIPSTTVDIDNYSSYETSTILYETSTKSMEDEIITSTTSKEARNNILRSRDPFYNRHSRTRPTSRHRFSSPQIHMSPSLLKLRGNKIVNPSVVNLTSSEEIQSEVISYRLNKIIPEAKIQSTTTELYDDVTEAPLSKSANPTESKNTKNSPLPTTPITKTIFIPRRFTYDVTRSFNCFGKKLNNFFEDPRDCRLFHYCTHGYSENQVVDMKFVCDYGTYFDSNKLICTKIRPQRCK